VIEVFEVDAAAVARVAAPKIVEKIEVSVADEMFAEFIKSAGADVVREHGVISGEVCGLEVCRVVRATDSGEFGGAGESGEASDSELEIGVGAHDRETFKLLHGRTATIESLRKVIAEVAARRAVGAQVHPLNRLARERMLRHYVCQSPQLVGAKSLQVAQPPIVRTNLKDVVPCCAVGVSLTGEKMIVIFNVGVDPDVVSFGADARGQINGSAELIFAMPTRDIMPAVERVAQMLRRPARFVGVDVIESSFKP
jgi:tetrahydromethanopterin S-methyltransferase subunit G